MSMLFKRIKDWAVSITSFRTGDVIPVDGPSGTAKMTKDNLLKETANNALAVTKEAIFSKVFNGGVGNSANAWKVRTSGIPIPNRGTIQFYTTRPLPEGHYYRVGYILTDDETAAGKEFHNDTIYNVLVLRTEDLEKIKLGEAINLSAYPKAKVVALEVAEFDETGTHVTLRASDFAGYDIRLVPFSQNFVNRNANNKCIAYWETHTGGSVSFSFRCQVGANIFTGFVIARMTWGSSTNAFTYLLSDDSMTFPFRMRTDGTRTVVDVSGTTFLEINVLNCSESVRVGYGYSYPIGWDEGNAYNVNPALETFKNRRFADVPSGGVVAYLPNSYGGMLSFAYRCQIESGVMVTGFATATFTNVSTSGYKKIDYVQYPMGKAFPFKMRNDGTRTIIELVSGSLVNVAAVSCSGNWNYTNKNWDKPLNWNESSATDIGEINDLLDIASYLTISKLNCEVLDGGVNNTANAWKVRTTGIKISNKTSYQISINRPLAAGHYYSVGWILSNDETDSGKAISLGGAHVITSRTEDIAKILLGDLFNFEAYSAAKVVAFEIAEYDETDNYVTLRKEDFGDDFISILPVPNQDGVIVDETLDYSLLNAAARINYASNGSKDFCSLIVTDSHNDDTSVSRAVSYAGKSGAVSALIHGGDYVSSYVTYGQASTNWATTVSGSSKPAFFVQGNHEKGTFYNIKMTPSDETLYNLFVKPSVDKGFLTVGEYEQNKCYYFHDFSTLKTRLIVLDEYRAPTDYLETYWQAITYDATLSDVADNTDYAIGDKVNVHGFTANSFQAVQAVNTGTYYSGKQPCYKCRRGYRYIDQTEAQWFLDTLYSTPSDYVVVVAMHNPFSDIAVPDKTKKFCQQVNIGESVTGADWAQNYMATDFVADALNAFKTGVSYSATISTKSNTEAAYISDYSVAKDFSVRGEGKLGLIIGGHVHRDVVWKHPTYTYMYQVTPMCSITTSRDNNWAADIRLQNDTSFEKYIDSLTAFAVADGRAALAKLGCKYTTDALVRDIEIL